MAAILVSPHERDCSGDPSRVGEDRLGRQLCVSRRERDEVRSARDGREDLFVALLHGSNCCPRRPCCRHPFSPSALTKRRLQVKLHVYVENEQRQDVARAVDKDAVRNLDAKAARSEVVELVSTPAKFAYSARVSRPLLLADRRGLERLRGGQTREGEHLLDGNTLLGVLSLFLVSSFFFATHFGPARHWNSPHKVRAF